MRLPSCLSWLILAALASALNAAERDPAKPNVVFILADDLGWSDTTLFGTTKLYETPNIERLAARGMTFTRAYSASPLCSPTRASILTGLSPAKHGITSPTCHLPQVILKPTAGATAAPERKSVPVTSVTRLSTDHYTMAEAFHDAGYATGHFGKWHLGHEPYSPLEHGFDVDVPHWPGPGPAGSYVAPWRFPDFDPDTPKQHIEDRMAKEAVAFMQQHRDRPFFLNYWMFSVHAPFDAKKKLIEKYRGKVDPKDPQRCPTYGAMIESMDDAVGTLLEALDRLELSKNTIIVFASDNGGNMYNVVEGERPTSNAPLRGGKATMFEGGVRGPCIVACPGTVKPGTKSDQLINSCDFFPTLLEMTAAKAKPDQAFDGVSILPALRGGSLKRRELFTYFPHNPRVPDWLPPAVSIHRDEWKLIRIFHGGDDGAHRWKLFNLETDIGEQNNLASKHPERVSELDARIEEFLNDADAVRPTRNPRFDPKQYRPEMEGRQIPKSSRPKRRGQPPVAGWRPGGDCRLKLEQKELVITSTGNDPHLSFTLAKPLPQQAMTVRIGLTSKGGGRGQWFWGEQGVTPAFFRERSATFTIKHDGKRHDYELPFKPSKPVTAIRLDPGQRAGNIRLHSIEIRGGDKVLYRWP